MGSESYPCLQCGLNFLNHRPQKYRPKHDKDRPEHPCVGDPCEKCGQPKYKHRPNRVRKTDAQRVHYIGIDGEGQGRIDHKYVMITASTKEGGELLADGTGGQWVVEAPRKLQSLDTGLEEKTYEYERGLTTKECLDFILSLPTTRKKIFSFSFNYDITKMITDLPDASIYALFRPDLASRQPTGKDAEYKGASPIVWDDYALNLQGTKFTVERISNGKRVVIWDLFKFFQGKFVAAIEDWKIGGEDARAYVRKMKDARSDFDKLPPEEVQKYCLQETRWIAELAGALIAAHEKAGLVLKSFYGAGSSGAAMLESMGIQDKLAPNPPEMRRAIGQSFFGGRFENSVIGTIREPLVNFDISSAYVYELAFLPCLLHATWRHTTNERDVHEAKVSRNAALIRYSLRGATHMRNIHDEDKPLGAWGPFPFRGKDGSIAFPIESGGGWVWSDEFFVGKRIFPHVGFREAWVYERNCDCKPFSEIPQYYAMRIRIGKEGPGIVIKLGMNSCYGKLAQSIGSAKFNNWIWAAMITSGCRAQLLEMLYRHRNPANLLMFATDGVLTRERDIVPPVPLDTKTDGVLDDKGKITHKPLGGWERKECPKGVFIARPGIYFPLEPTSEEISAVRARGVGRTAVLNHWNLIVEAWERDGANGIAKMPNVSRFCGAKTSISVSGNGKRFKRAKGTDGAPSYGQWISRPVELTFNPLPKRERMHEDGLTLVLRSFPGEEESVPYARAMRTKDSRGRFMADPSDPNGDLALSIVSADTLMMRRAEEEALEQPDGDITEYEFDMFE